MGGSILHYQNILLCPDLKLCINELPAELHDFKALCVNFSLPCDTHFHGDDNNNNNDDDNNDDNDNGDNDNDIMIWNLDWMNYLQHYRFLRLCISITRQLYFLPYDLHFHGDCNNDSNNYNNNDNDNNDDNENSDNDNIIMVIISWNNDNNYDKHNDNIHGKLNDNGNNDDNKNGIAQIIIQQK